ncbi:hypothetical protein DVH24_023458 [Malus domestica]|uniref:Uncharacterized protein n=1 Tax=Malus domestica TaxID=3750 RepID=A0A498I4R5_MALDO|nr:hypothetical protein DVH24_023458 [Malus domestica]
MSWSTFDMPMSTFSEAWHVIGMPWSTFCEAWHVVGMPWSTFDMPMSTFCEAWHVIGMPWLTFDMPMSTFFEAWHVIGMPWLTFSEAWHLGGEMDGRGFLFTVHSQVLLSLDVYRAHLTPKPPLKLGSSGTLLPGFFLMSAVNSRFYPSSPRVQHPFFLSFDSSVSLHLSALRFLLSSSGFSSVFRHCAPCCLSVSSFLFREIISGETRSLNFAIVRCIGFVSSLSTESIYMLLKGWYRLIQDLITREGPFLEIACIPVVGLTILLWRIMVVLSIVLAVFMDILIGLCISCTTISKLEEALWISHRKYDALWGWEMLKLLVHYVLQTRMRQRFQKVLHCFQKAFNEVVPLTNLKETILFFNFRCVIRRVVNDGPFVVNHGRHLWDWIALKMDFHRLGTPYDFSRLLLQRPCTSQRNVRSIKLKEKSHTDL